MITNSEFQEALITRLRDNTRAEIAALHAALAGGDASEVRENQFQGTEFSYPAIRVSVNYNNPTGEGPCRDDVSRIYFSITAWSESTSSKEADDLLGLVGEALDEAIIDDTDFRTGNISLGSLNSAIRIAPRLWRAEAPFRANIYQKT